MCTLVCKEGELLVVSIETIRQSELISGLIDEEGTEGDIPVSQVSKVIMEKVITYLEHIRSNSLPELEKPLTSTDLAQCGNIDQWYVDFVDVEKDELFELCLAADNLVIKPLQELTAAKIATQIKGKSVKEIRQFFDIENDFTPEEEAQIMEENKWAEESF